MFEQSVYTKPDEAAKQLAELEEMFANVDENNPAWVAYKQTVARNLVDARRRVGRIRGILSLEGKPARPIGAADWVNGKEMTAKDLEGKVVVLDFWALWCRPCIRTFPHLREWHKKYSKDGLVILGVTRYYRSHKFEDGDVSDSATPPTAEEERQMLVNFAKHHKLAHTFAVVGEGNDIHSDYKVSGIPQVVVIDRQGKIRRIRVGSGEQTATDIEEAIKKCLQEKPAAN